MDANRFRFRVWDKKKGIMRLWDWLCRQEFPFLIEPADNICGVFRDENYILMQSTGLCDREGKQIYEGDILNHAVGFTIEQMLEHNPPEAIRLIVSYENCCWWIKPTHPDLVHEDDQEGDPLHEWLKSEYKIIGNIYEHSHLLEPAGKEGVV